SGRGHHRSPSQTGVKAARCDPMKGVLAACVVLLAPAAYGDMTDAEAPAPGSGVASVEAAAALPQTSGAGHPYDHAVVNAFGGYDGAHKAGAFDAIAELKLIGPLSIRGGASYVSDRDEVKPTIGLVLQFLRQDAHGVSASFGVFYRPEGRTEPEGEIEGILAATRVFDRTTVAVNLVYGQDGEGSERDGEVKLAVLQRIGQVFVGVDSRLRFAIGDPKMGEPRHDFIGGPVGSYAFGEWAATAAVGLSLVAFDTTQTGILALGGFSHVF